MEEGLQPSVTNPQPEADPKRKKRRKQLIILLVAVSLAAVIVMAFLAVTAFVLDREKAAKKETTTAITNDPAAATKLFDALGKGAAKQNLKVSQLRTTFANKADMDSGANPGFVQSSVSEVDVTAGKYRALYAQKVFDTDIYRMQRCMDGTTYIDGLDASGLNRQAPKSLTEANQYLKQMYAVTENLQYIICPHIGIMPGGTTDLAPARLSDGLMPVTLDETQASDWKAGALAANLFDVKDEGMVEHGGKQLHKYSFAPRAGATNINQKLYDLFYSTADIDKVKREHPDAEWQYEFIAVNRANSGSVQGFYLIDDQTGLPAYSELRGINPDRDNGTPAARNNIGFNKQTYAYPTGPTVSLSSSLEFLR